MKKILKRGMSGLLAVLMAFTVLAGFGTTTAFAASETAESYMISFPRDGDAAQIYSEDAWGHSAKSYMNGWATGSSNYTTLHCMDSFDGKVCYCIEPGLSRNVGDTYHGFGEDFWDNYPSQYNNTIEPDDIISIIRGKGIDRNAMNHILEGHCPNSIQFVDGWTGKGAIQNELIMAMRDFPGVSPGLAVLSDPAYIAEKCGTHDDFLIASSCLNSVVSGLISRTFYRSDIIGEMDYHGAAFYSELRGEDLTYQFIDTVPADMSIGR